MNLLLLLERLGRRRHKKGASGIWTAVALTAYLLKRYDRHVRHKVDMIREPLRPGETLVITHTTEMQA